MKPLILFFSFFFATFCVSSQNITLDSISSSTVCDGNIDVYFSVTPGYYNSSVHFHAVGSFTGNWSYLNGAIYNLPATATGGVIHVTNLTEGIGNIKVLATNITSIGDYTDTLHIESGIFGTINMEAYEHWGSPITSAICNGMEVRLYTTPTANPAYFSITNNIGLPVNPNMIYYPTDSLTFIIAGQVPGVNCPVISDTVTIDVVPPVSLSFLPNDSSFCGDSLWIHTQVSGGSGLGLSTLLSESLTNIHSSTDSMLIYRDFWLSRNFCGEEKKC